MKFIEFHYRIMKKNENINIPCQNHENREIQRIPNQNYENLENLIISIQNN